MCFDLLDEQCRVMINPLMDIPPMRKSKDALHIILRTWDLVGVGVLNYRSVENTQLRAI